MSTSAETLGPGTFAADRVRADTRSRIASIDIMRGLVIVLMMMDHVRERFFLHVPVTDPMDVDATAPALYFTRYLAHFCAPVFIFLTGLSGWLYSHPANGGYRSPTGFLFKRGLFLVFIEVTVIYLVWASTFTTLYLQVIWAIGLCMIALSVLARLNYWLIGALGFAIVFGHNLLSPISFAPDEFGYTLWTILHDRNFLVEDGIVPIKVSYPVLPWIGVILLGYFAGPLYGQSMDRSTRRKALVALGLGCLALLLVLRGFNIYGETLPWTVQETGVRT
ncbi:MAG TPA: heparan-alpha-glucosaminide N-acetyltransferase domain-containing protein, partial [Anaerolineae bacterium]|nr:heparan-alpha-glucosaminide N-acetyltransferase domain-containing protein [Anaerolineae bacterium]